MCRDRTAWHGLHCSCHHLVRLHLVVIFSNRKYNKADSIRSLGSRTRMRIPATMGPSRLELPQFPTTSSWTLDHRELCCTHSSEKSEIIGFAATFGSRTQRVPLAVVESTPSTLHSRLPSPTCRLRFQLHTGAVALRARWVRTPSSWQGSQCQTRPSVSPPPYLLQDMALR